MNRTGFVLAAAAVLLLTCPCAVLAEGSPDDVLVENSVAKLTRGDYEADLQRVPPDMRNAFASDPKRLTLMLNNMLIAKTLAAEARQAGTDRDPLVGRRVALESDRVLAQAQIQRIEEAAGAEFDARQADFLLKAREAYALDKDKYRLPEQVQAAHILFDTRKNEPDAALARAKETRDKLLAGADFVTLAKQLSDDATTKNNGGEMGWFGPGQTDPALIKAAFELKNVGDISEPVRSSYGYHLIRFEGRRPGRQLSFDEVKDQIMAGLRTRYVTEQREAKLASIRNDPKVKVDQGAVDALVYQIDPQLFKQALPLAK
jgi:peptidyl-prolyl cis-trans isomerase C